MKKTENFGEEKSPPSIMVWGKIVGQHEEYTSVMIPLEEYIPQQFGEESWLLHVE